MRNVCVLLLASVIVTGFAFTVSAEESEAAASCLAAAAKGDRQTAVRLCSTALEAEPENEAVEKALETAKAASEASGAVASPPPAASEEN